MEELAAETTILKEVIADDLKPLRKGGVTFYPADSLERIFKWAKETGRRVEWVEGLFYRADTHEGQLSLGYMCERQGAEDDAFLKTCLSLIDEFEAEAVGNGMGAYFEIGITA